MTLDCTILIPARLASTRLPGKPLADLGGLPMIVRVAQRCTMAGARDVVVATDAPEVAAACTAHGVLVAKLPGRNFDYFLTQRGMFSYTGLTAEQAERLKTEFGVYILRSGRMCVAGLNTRNVDATAVAMAAVLGG